MQGIFKFCFLELSEIKKVYFLSAVGYVRGYGGPAVVVGHASLRPWSCCPYMGAFVCPFSLQSFSPFSSILAPWETENKSEFTALIPEMGLLTLPFHG